MELQLTITGTSGKGVVVVQTPQELWDALVGATEPALGVIPVHRSIRVNRVITVTENVTSNPYPGNPDQAMGPGD